MKKAYFKAMILLLLVLAASAAAQTLYFLPPNDPEWMRRTPNILDKNSGYSATAMKIDTDPGSCGWFKIDLSGKTDHELIIWPGKPKAGTLNNDVLTDRFGVNGVDDGPDTWTGTPSMPTPIVFNDKAGTPWFDPSKGASGWTANRPALENTNRCNYNMAAIIYDTDPSRIDAFKCANTGGCNFDDDPAGGILKNIPKPKLELNDKGVPKMVWSGKGGKGRQENNGWNEEDFKKAFNCSPNVNSMICYDMPFQRDSKGSWTFDSDFLCRNGDLDLKEKRVTDTTEVRALCNTGGRGGPALGFFPNRLNKENDLPYGWKQNENPPLDASCTYEQCPSCADKSEADPLAPFYATEKAAADGTQYDDIKGIAVNPECYRKGLASTSPTGACGNPYTEGQFKHGEDPKIWNWALRGFNTASWQSDWTRPPRPYLRDYFSGNTNMSLETYGGDNKRNQYFCFESHADFIYEAGQEFYFSGDDDIWVFINNRIVIDNGGNHLAAPGYVELDKIGVSGSRWANAQAVSGVADPSESLYPKLEEGEEYKLDIFFCDRRQTSSNIRVSTNMYISQKNGLMVDKGDGKNQTAELCLQTSGSGTCASLLSGGSGSGTTKKCGADIGGQVGFYLINRKGDVKYLLDGSNPAANCTGSNGDYKCFGGINVYESNGTAKVDMKDISGLTSTWYLYAYVKNNPGDLIEPEKIATITITTDVRTAWGEIREGSSNGRLLTNLCKNPVTAATGELVPICFSSGEQVGGNFISDDAADIGGLGFRLKGSSFTSLTSKSRLKVFYDSLGTLPVDASARLTLPGGNGEPPRENSGSVPGVLVLWVSGDYTQNVASDTYKINVDGKGDAEEYSLTSVIPKLQWVKADFQTSIPSGDQKGVKWRAPDVALTAAGLEREGGYPAPVWIGENVKLYLRALAYNGSEGNWTKTCGTCNYDLDFKANANGGITETNGRLISTSGFKIKNGKASLEIAGKKEVMPPKSAELIVHGNYEQEQVRWDSLFFQDPPVPFPENVWIFDSNGDGVGDSLVIAYSRGYDPDSLPNMIEVQWAKDTTIAYGIGKQTSDGSTYEKPNNGDNLNYWSQQLVCNGGCGAGRFLDAAALNARRGTGEQKKALKDTIILYRDPKTRQDSVRFSKDVLTRPTTTSKINNWVSFSVNSRNYDIALNSGITDSIPAVVVSARYTADENNKGCGTIGNPCYDKVIIELSEPIKMVVKEDTTESLRKNTFAYMLRDIGRNDWNILEEGFLPTVRWQIGSTDKINPSKEENDSIVSLFFYRYREGDNKSKTPMPGDSVKFASIAKGYAGFTKNILVDTHDNPPNPKEWGRQLEGRKPFTPDKIPIGEIDPNYPDDYINKIKETLDNNGSEGYPDNLFNINKPIEVLPVPPDWTIKEVQEHYPGTVGILFNPDVFNSVSDLEDLYCDPKGSHCISDGNITIYPRAFFHTNLGNFVADRDFAGGIKCNDPIFPRNDKDQPSCRDSRSKFYIAWDMKDTKGRFVGAGAYVGIYDFRWEVYIPSKNLTQKMETIERQIEMHGVKRVKKR